MYFDQLFGSVSVSVRRIGYSNQRRPILCVLAPALVASKTSVWRMQVYSQSTSVGVGVPERNLGVSQSGLCRLWTDYRNDISPVFSCTEPSKGRLAWCPRIIHMPAKDSILIDIVWSVILSPANTMLVLMNASCASVIHAGIRSHRVIFDLIVALLSEICQTLWPRIGLIITKPWFLITPAGMFFLRLWSWSGKYVSLWWIHWRKSIFIPSTAWASTNLCTALDIRLKFLGSASDVKPDEQQVPIKEDNKARAP